MKLWNAKKLTALLSAIVLLMGAFVMPVSAEGIWNDVELPWGDEVCEEHQYDNSSDAQCNKCEEWRIVITTQPAKTTYGSEGAKVTVKVAAKGDGLKYVWFIKDAKDANFTETSTTTNSYTATMSDSTHGRQLYCVITDTHGNKVQSSTATIYRQVTITKESSTAAYAKNGSSVSVSVTAKGTSLTYAWYKKDAGATKFTKTSVTKSTYTATMSSDIKGDSVYCVVTDKYGKTDTSKTFTLYEAVSITTQPKTTYTQLDSTAKVTVKASGDGLTYAWYIKDSGASKYSKSSVTSSTYSTKMTSGVKNRQVYCVVTDKYGKTATTETVYLRQAVSITTQPKTTYTKLDSTAKVTVMASGDGLTYAWYVKNSGATKFTKSSVTSSTYSAKMSSSVKNRQVYCVVTDKYGKTATTETVTMRQAASITTQPKTAYAKSGSTAKVTVKASGDGLTYTWYLKDKGASKYSKSSVTASSYSVKMSSKVKNRQVYCVVKDKYGKSVQTNTVYLRQAVSITTQPKTTYAKVDTTVKVTVKASGDGLKYAWYVKSAGSTKFSKSSITASSYAANMSSKVKNRQVYCVVTDKYGKTATTETVYLRQAATITIQPKNTYTKLNSTAKVTVKGSGDGVKYTWYVKDAGASKFTKSSVTSSTYSVKMTSKVKNRQVYCVVTDKYGKTATSKTVTMRQAATITTQPKAVTVAKNKTAKVTVKASGDGLKYTWYVKNAGATKYTKSSVTTSSYSVKMTSKVNGRYVYCVVTDKYGKTVKSTVVRVKMK